MHQNSIASPKIEVKSWKHSFNTAFHPATSPSSFCKHITLPLLKLLRAWGQGLRPGVLSAQLPQATMAASLASEFGTANTSCAQLFIKGYNPFANPSRKEANGWQHTCFCTLWNYNTSPDLCLHFTCHFGSHSKQASAYAHTLVACSQNALGTPSSPNGGGISRGSSRRRWPLSFVQTLFGSLNQATETNAETNT